MKPKQDAPISLAVVTGGHAYDVKGFHGLFRRFPEFDAYVQHMDDFCSSPEDVRDAYDVVLFYLMMSDGPGGGPDNEGSPWYAGKPRAALERLGVTAQGIVLLHHTLVAYPEWEFWTTVTGLPKRKIEWEHDQETPIHVADSNHAVTKGVSDWTIRDETYLTDEPDENSHVVLFTDHPRSTRAIAWTRQLGAARVFCYQSGHDDHAWSDMRFQRVLTNGIEWAAQARQGE